MIAALRKNMTNVIVGVVVLAIALGCLYYFVLRDAGNKTVTARFPAAVGVYPGTPVKLLGVQIGDVTSVSPKPGYVEVKMEYSKSYKLPAKGGAEEVANSLVSDRYIQLAPAYKSGPVMKSGATIPSSRTGAPAELDDIYSALNKLSVALGPAGANKGGQQTGALSALVNVSAANLKGNGAALGNSITKLSEAARTLADNRGNLFATVRNLQQFTTTLKNSDSDVRNFNAQLEQAASDLAGERGDLGSAAAQPGPRAEFDQHLRQGQRGQVPQRLQRADDDHQYPGEAEGVAAGDAGAGAGCAVERYPRLPAERGRARDP